MQGQWQGAADVHIHSLQDRQIGTAEAAFLPINIFVSTTTVHNTEIVRSQQAPDAVCVYSQGLDASLLAQVPQPDGLIRRA